MWTMDSELTRRKLLRDAGVVGGALVLGGSLGAGRALAGLTGALGVATAGALALTPEAEEGPFYGKVYALAP